MPAPHRALGLLADRGGKGKHYREALKVDPAFVASRVNLARRLFERGAFDDAREQFLRLTQVYAQAEEILAPLTADIDRPRAGAAWSCIGVARLGRGDRAGARAAAKEALLVSSSDGVAQEVARRAVGK